MIKVKHLMDALETDDGQRIWVEPFGLCLDLKEWCRIDHVLPHLGPSRKIWDTFEKHPDAWEYFRGEYHEQLRRSPYRAAMMSLARASKNENFTLIHSADDCNQNSAAALHEFLSDLEAMCPPE